MKPFLKYSVSIIVALLLTGCTSLNLPASPQKQYQTLSWSKRKQTLSEIQNWSIRGAFSIQQHGKTSIAAYEWRQKDKTYQIRIHSSLDIYSILLTGQAGKVSLSRSSHQHVTASTPEKLMRKELGWSLPLESLNYWMRGLPGPGKQKSQFDAYQHLISLSQQGWTIHFSRYLSVGKVDLPQMLILDRGALHARIVIKQWELH